MGLLISVEALQKLNDALIFDCRSSLADKAAGRKQYLEGHIPGAQHADMDKHLAAAPGDGGRHPLPEREDFEAQLNLWGMTPSSTVVCYDQNNGAFAARMWWMLRWLGHDNVFVLDGGLDAWKAANQPLETDEPSYPPGRFVAGAALTKQISAAEIANWKGDLLDARDAARYRGESEPIDPVAGHIPGAICAQFTDNLSEGRFKAAPNLTERFESLGVETATPTACYCGSGVTATHNILALLLAGYPEPSLYPGSWSEWIVDPNRPVETG